MRVFLKRGTVSVGVGAVHPGGQGDPECSERGGVTFDPQERFLNRKLLYSFGVCVYTLPCPPRVDGITDPPFSPRIRRSFHRGLYKNATLATLPMFFQEESDREKKISAHSPPRQLPFLSVRATGGQQSASRAEERRII